MFNKILVAVDGSRTSLKALEKAIELKRSTGGKAEILLLCVYKHHSLFEASLAVERPEAMQIPDQALSEYARSVIEHARAFAAERDEQGLRGFIKNGRPAKAIIEFSQEQGADLIVAGNMGNHSRDGILLGSVAHRVASMAKCPVLIV